jgi:ParB family chromosome partitioning protein
MASSSAKKKRIEASAAAALAPRPPKVAAPPKEDGPGRVRIRVDDAAFRVPLAQLHPDPKQPRKEFDEEALRKFGQRLRRKQLQSILVTRAIEGYTIVDGERRYRAALAVGMTELLARIDSSAATPADRLADQLAANLDREDLSDADLAVALHELREVHGWTQAKIAQRIDTSQSRVSRCLSLMDLPATVFGLVQTKELAPSTALAIAKAHPGDELAVVEAAQEAVAKGTTRAEVLCTVHKTEPPDPAPFDRGLTVIEGPGKELRPYTGKAAAPDVADPATSAEAHLVNANGVYLDPEVIKVPIPKGTGCDAQVAIAQGADGLWRHAEVIGMPMGRGGRSSSGVMSKSPGLATRQLAIGMACTRIVSCFLKHGHAKAAQAVDDFITAQQRAPAAEAKPATREVGMQVYGPGFSMRSLDAGALMLRFERRAAGAAGRQPAAISLHEMLAAARAAVTMIEAAIAEGCNRPVDESLRPGKAPAKGGRP